MECFQRNGDSGWNKKLLHLSKFATVQSSLHEAKEISMYLQE